MIFVLAQICLWTIAATFGLSSLVSLWLLRECFVEPVYSHVHDMQMLEILWVVIPSVAATLLASGWAVAEIVRR